MNPCTMFLLVGRCGNYVASHDADLLNDLWEEQIGNDLVGSRVLQFIVNVPDEVPMVVELSAAQRPEVKI